MAANAAKGVKMKKFELIHTGGPYGDETSTYDGHLNMPLTVNDFVITVLNNYKDEWGIITIGPHLAHIEYRYGQITDTSHNIDKYLNKKIKSFNARGGWTLMDYALELEEKNE